MTTITRLVAVGSIALLSMTSHNAHAQLPNCVSASSDSDGDGFGWENSASCRVVSSSGTASTFSSSSSGSSFPACQSASSDPDGDGYGFENGVSCLVSGGTSSSGSANASSSGGSTSSGFPTCQSASSDPDGDGYGFENGVSCLVTASTGIISDDDNDSPISDLAGSATSNGISDIAGSATSNGVTPVVPDSDSGSDGTGGNANNGGSFASSTVGGAITRVNSLPTVSPASRSVGAAGGDLFATLPVGDFLLHQNAWRSQVVAPGHNWSQTVFTNSNGAPVGWNYDWGPGVPGRNGRASDDFFVRSYPEVIFGIKDEFRTSAPQSVIGLPVRIDSMPSIQIDYTFSSQQFGEPRQVDASVNPRFPNGTSISGERNVAVESFLYSSENGVCDDSLNVSRSSGSNHEFEVMVWLDSGAERLPAASNDFVTTISLRGASYNVYTKNDDERYIAFVAQDPVNSGSVVWNDFVDWARINAHVVSENFGARSNAVPIQDDWCMANILIGTEIFWGAANFDLLEWTITQRQ